MTTAAEPMVVDRADVRTIVGGGVKLGILTAVGVVAFALLARAMSGNTETLVLSLLVLTGGVVFGYLPALWTRPRSADGIAWCTLLGLLGAVAFTVLDVVLLRPLSVYHWTWDAIGGGSGFWYIPVWWMGSAFLAWLGGMVVAYAAQGGRDPQPLVQGLQTGGIAVILFGIITGLTIAPFHPAVVALAFAIALALHVPLSAVMHRR